MNGTYGDDTIQEERWATPHANWPEDHAVQELLVNICTE